MTSIARREEAEESLAKERAEAWSAYRAAGGSDRHQAVALELREMQRWFAAVKDPKSAESRETERRICARLGQIQRLWDGVQRSKTLCAGQVDEIVAQDLETFDCTSRSEDRLRKWTESALAAIAPQLERLRGLEDMSEQTADHLRNLVRLEKHLRDDLREHEQFAAARPNLNKLAGLRAELARLDALQNAAARLDDARRKMLAPAGWR